MGMGDGKESQKRKTFPFPRGNRWGSCNGNCETGQESRVKETPSAQLRKSGGVLTSFSSPRQLALRGRYGHLIWSD